MHDAEDHIAAKAKGHKVPKAKPRDVEEHIAAKVAKASSGPIAKIHKHLIKKALQEQATQEHKSINKREDYNKELLARIKDIQSRMGGKGPAQPATGERRIIGLVL
jgi:hypothetical protein